MFIRYSIATVFAAAVAFALFFVMQGLIAISTRKDDTVYRKHVVDFVRARRDETTQEKKRTLPQKAAPHDNPTPPPMSLPSTNDNMGASNSVAVAAPSVDQAIDISGGPQLGRAPSDTDVIPLVRIEPQYPPYAAEQKIEGWVEFVFTISGTGTVKNLQVVASDPPGVFERAAIHAIRKWKYKPKIENGKPVERNGVKVVLTFKLTDQE